MGEHGNDDCPSSQSGIISERSPGRAGYLVKRMLATI
jgi:hypothetical protein